GPPASAGPSAPAAPSGSSAGGRAGSGALPRPPRLTVRPPGRPASSLRQADAEVAVVSGVGHRRHDDPLHPRQRRAHLQIVQGLGDRGAGAPDPGPHPSLVQVEGVAGGPPVAGPPPRADASPLPPALRRGPGGQGAPLRATVPGSSAPAGTTGAGRRNGRGDWI